jgi:hypothetical protein
LIDAIDPHRLSRLVSRLIDAAEQTRPDNFFTPGPNMWSYFLFEAFNTLSYTGTKFLCLEEWLTWESAYEVRELKPWPCC